MELNKLGGFVVLVVMVAMIIGIGIITLDKFGTTVSYDVLNHNDSVTKANFTGQALDWGNITTVDAVWNGTTSLLPAECYTLNTTPGQFMWTNSTADCAANSGAVDQTVFYIIYDAKDYNTKTAQAAAAASKEVANISTNWLGLIVTIAVLALILWLVMGAFCGAV